MQSSIFRKVLSGYDIKPAIYYNMRNKLKVSDNIGIILIRGVFSVAMYEEPAETQ